MPILPISTAASRVLALLLLSLATAPPVSSSPAEAKAGPPPTRVDDFKETLHGVEIADPYRWLEDQESAETRGWIDAQNTYSHGMLEKLPARAAIRKRLAELLAIDRVTMPSEQNGRYLFEKKGAADEVWTLYQRRGREGRDELLLDPRTFAADGSVSLETFALSHDGKLLVYGIRHGGEDEVELRLKDLDSGMDLPERFPRALYRGVVLLPDRSGLYYNLQSRETGTLAYYHALGTDRSKDVEVFGRGYGRDKWLGAADVSSDGRFVLFVVNHGWGRTEMYLLDRRSNGPMRTLANDLDAHFNVQIAGDVLYAFTDWQAGNGRMLAIDLKDPSREKWRELVPAGPDPIQSYALAGGKLFVHYLHDVTSRVRIFSLDGKPQGELTLPGTGSVSGLEGRWDGGELFFDFQSFTVPQTVFRYDVATGKVETWSRSAVPFRPDPYEVKQVWYTSKDGTRVPMFLVHRKGIALDGRNPIRLYGYGGFRVSLRPFFSATTAWWLEQGGVYAMANLRGGNEFGEDWHRAGMLDKKQNVFDDFVAAAEWLIANRYTSPSRLAIEGTSNGGLLVGAALTQRPDLFQAVLCRFPDLDMIGYHRFKNNNPPALLEYGDAGKPEQFKFLAAYSPYQQVKPGTQYPAVLLETGDADTRVPPLQARKMTARLQAATASDRPILLLYDTQAGHAGDRTTSKVLDDSSLEMAFLAWQLGVEVK